MPRVFILALDGVEYELVVGWKLRNLMQKHYGSVDISEFRRNFGRASTPTLWSSFITGKYLNIGGWWTYGKILDWVRVKPPLRWIKHKRKIFWKFIRPRVVDKRELGCKTIFDHASKSIAVNIPAYNEPTEFHVRLTEAILSKGLDEYEREIWSLHNQRAEETFKKLEEDRDWTLFMTWFDLADLLGHIHIAKRVWALKKGYEHLDELAGNLSRKVGENSIFLIVSDHGMKPMPDGTGDHTNHTFYSLNHAVNWKPKKIVDFHQKILEWLSE